MDANIIDYLRQFRIAGFAVFDTTLSFLGVYLLAPLLTKLFRHVGLEIPRKSWLYLVLPLGILAHYLSGNRTPLTREFFDPDGYYFLKGIILLLLILGLRGAKLIGKGKN